MSIRSYRDLEVWQKSMDLTVDIYKCTENYPKYELYGLANQMRRAAVSIAANISEGSERQGTKELIHFLAIASGSLAESETYILLSERLGYLSSEQAELLLEKMSIIGRMIVNLQKSLAKKL